MAATATAAASARRAAGAVAAVAGRAASEPGRRAAEGRVSPVRPATPPRLRAVGADERLPRPARSARQRRFLVLFGAGLVLTVGLLANLAIHVQTTQGQFELDRLQAEATAKEAAYQKLRVDVARLEAPQRVVAQAKRLGMVEPPEVRYLSPDGSTSVVDPATGRDRSALPGGSEAAGGAQAWGEVKSQLGGGR